MVGDKKFDPKLQVESGNQENSTLSPRCSICKVRKYATHKSFCSKSIDNLQKNVSKPFKCSICNYEARFKCNLKTHVVGVHKMEFNPIQNTWISRITYHCTEDSKKQKQFVQGGNYHSIAAFVIIYNFFHKSCWKNFW